MKLLDTNIILYSYLPEYYYLKNIFREQHIYTSAITRIEVLGYHKLTQAQEDYFSDIFNLVTVIFPSQKIFDSAIKIRRQYNLKLGDSLIAATAKVHNLEIYSRNVKDFGKMSEINCINPII